MTPDFVADVGNTRIKYARCGREPGGTLVGGVAVLAGDDPGEWHGIAHGSWAVAGVHPHRRDRFAVWLRGCGADVWVLQTWSETGLTVDVDFPERVGHDRLLNALAARRRARPGYAAVAIDAGTAVTVDAVTADGTFVGGTIAPGYQLMAQSLRDHTALLPLILPTHTPGPRWPPRNTADAISAGVWAALAGGVDRARAQVADALAGNGCEIEYFLTGGDAAALGPRLVNWAGQTVPELTLEGVRLAAERRTK